MSVEEKVKGIIAKQLGVDIARVPPEASFVDDFNAGLLDLIDIADVLNEEFGLKMPDNEIEKMLKLRVGDMVVYIESGVGVS